MNTVTVNRTRVSIAGYPGISARFEWAVTFGALWILIGLYLDGAAHVNFSETIDNFFTPWHGILYSGLAASIAVLGTVYLTNLVKGYNWLRALPPAYMRSILGAAIFFAAGIADLFWHETFGFEANIEALVSPSHLSLAVGAVLMISGPLRMAWGGDGSRDAKMPWTAVLSMFTALGVFTFFTQFASAFAESDLLTNGIPAGDTHLLDKALISGVLIPSALLMVFILLATLRWKLPAGSLTLLIAGNSILMFLLTILSSRENWPVLIAALLGGVIAEVLLRVLRPSRERLNALRWFSFLVPASL
ncbi:MAG: hypothetical protein L6Q49_14915, partial [Anaerolineales bacterium]|nr:hypothetical protein [Anaerolineales bacterium]